MKYSTKVVSSAINKIDYDTDSKVMTVEFKQCRGYDFPNVPEEEYQKFVSAESIGKYYNTHIKNVYGDKPNIRVTKG